MMRCWRLRCLDLFVVAAEGVSRFPKRSPAILRELCAFVPDDPHTNADRKCLEPMTLVRALFCPVLILRLFAPTVPQTMNAR